MKKRSTEVFAAILLISTFSLTEAESSTFEDKPALTQLEWVALRAAQAAGVAVGGYGGIMAGMYVGEKAAHILRNPLVDPTPFSPKKAKMQAGRTLPGITIGWVGGLGAGAYLGYKGGKSIAIRVLAKLHSVSYRIEKISKYYNINVPQYEQILIAAESRDIIYLKQAIKEVYSQRFGENWKDLLEKLFKKYGRRAEGLLKRYSSLTYVKYDEKKDFLRMVELGAAMANLYYGTDPDPKKTVYLAKDLYKELGLLK